LYFGERNKEDLTTNGKEDIIALSKGDNFDHSQKKTGQRQIIALFEDEFLLNLGYSILMCKEERERGVKGMAEPQKITDFIDIDLIQKIQDNCSKAMGIAFVTVDYKGVPITKYSGFTDHCNRGRKFQGFSEMCEQCDAHGGLHAAITGQPYVYRCHADLVDFAVPLIFNGSYMGSVMGGQLRLPDEEARQLERILPTQTNWHKNEELRLAYEQAPRTTYAKLEAAVQVVRDMILHVIRDQYQQSASEALDQKEKELAQERDVRNQLENTIRRKDIDALKQRQGFQYFFFVMNVLSRVAFEEGAPRCEALIYDFADMMRYITDSDQKICTLGEELNYVGAFLRVQQAWHGEKLSYSISVPERYWATGCPYMIFQPLLDSALMGIEESEGTREISIFAEEVGEDLMVQVLDNNDAATPEEMENRMSREDVPGSLWEADRRLKQVLGKRHGGLAAGPRRDGRPGVALTFRLRLEV